ncbi:Glycosyltransferase [Melia azedarach]|uniref:Glycosyltransferase n=1 Tax=Melia azedarach TaxID=155640 RepID=A0ACC1X7J7_MELAZ|nr:Glycosyltransferase [Melia azedarach]
MANSSELTPSPHIALLPSSGMGHLTPFLRLAALLAAQGVKITFITPLSKKSFICLHSTIFLHIRKAADPFYYHIEVTRRSCHLLSSLLPSLSPPLSAIITDMSLTATVVPITKALNIPNYIFFTSSAKMLTLFLSFHTLVGSKANTNLHEIDDIEIPTLEPIPKCWIPPPLLQDKNDLLKAYIIRERTLAALNGDKVIHGIPSVFAIGVLPPCGFQKTKTLAWLDDQAIGSVLYVSFGSRTALPREQLRELGDGLVRSGYSFLWVIKVKKVDREDDEQLRDVIGDELMESINQKGLVVKHWLDQENILRHPAIGGFLSHCGWNSVTEAIWHGVRVLAWPQHGDQKINADLVERFGMGIWPKSWGWGGEVIVKGGQIAEKVREVMRNELLKMQARKHRRRD